MVDLIRTLYRPSRSKRLKMMVNSEITEQKEILVTNSDF